MEQVITCPITGEIFADPVQAEDGHTYEKEAIIKWFKGKSTSPLTNIAIGHKLATNYTIKKVVAQFLEDNPERKTDQHWTKTKFLDRKDEIVECVTSGDFSIVNKIMDLDIKMGFYHKGDHYDLIEYIYRFCKDDDILTYCATNVPLYKKIPKGYGGYDQQIHFIVLYAPDEFIRSINFENCLKARGNDNRLPIHYALLRSTPTIAKWMINIYNITYNTTKTSTTEDMLYYAILGNHSEMVRQFWNPKNRYTFRQAPPLHFVCQHMSEDYMVKAIRSTIGTEHFYAVSGKKDNFIHIVFRYRDLKTCKKVLNEFFDPKLLSQQGMLTDTPVTVLAKRFFDDYELWQFLFNCVSNIPVNVLIKKTTKVKIQKMVIKYLMTIDNCPEKPELARTFFHVIRNWSDDMILNYYAAGCYLGERPLIDVCEYKPELAEYFIDATKDINDVNPINRQPALHYACRHCSEEVVQDMMVAGADPCIGECHFNRFPWLISTETVQKMKKGKTEVE